MKSREVAAHCVFYLLKSSYRKNPQKIKKNKVSSVYLDESRYTDILNLGKWLRFIAIVNILL